MAVTQKAVGEDALRKVFELISTEAVMSNDLGDGLNVDSNGKINVDLTNVALDVGDFYIDENGHLIWNRHDNGGKGYVLVRKGEDLTYADDSDIQAILDGIEL